ncbi:hypothetical protein ACF3MZ_14315 [Paenibacillaceae bacterium WGS1546]|uniref:hypothetical protein n=1 Tax=Cohnella sp. WGS1546 TaxID=3366810 RepID=UPI00372D2828
MLSIKGFVYTNVPITPNGYCATNDLHRRLAYLARETEHTRPWRFNASDDPSLTHNFADTPFDETTLGKVVASAQKWLLSDQEMGFPNETHLHQENLINSYLLSSSIIVAPVYGKNGVRYEWFTKSRDIVKHLAATGQLALKDMRNGVQRYFAQLNTSVEEIETGTFKVIRLSRDSDGVRISSTTLSHRSAREMLPDHMVTTLEKRLIHALQHYEIEMMYTDAGGSLLKVYGTLRPHHPLTPRALEMQRGAGLGFLWVVDMDHDDIVRLPLTGLTMKFRGL